MNVALRKTWTIEQFLEWEERQEFKYEFNVSDERALRRNAR
jgi:hypothetical protein